MGFTFKKNNWGGIIPYVAQTSSWTSVWADDILVVKVHSKVTVTSQSTFFGHNPGINVLAEAAICIYVSQGYKDVMMTFFVPEVNFTGTS